MNQNCNDNSQDEKLYIVKDRFDHMIRKRKRKGDMYRKTIDCRQDTIADLLSIGKRQYQKYIAGQVPVPLDSLTRLCEYLNINPDWLTGKQDQYTELHGQDTEEFRDALRRHGGGLALLGYLDSMGHKQDVEGLTTEEFEALIAEMQAACEYTIERFIKLALAARGGFTEQQP